jgi:hypothetical protein
MEPFRASLTTDEGQAIAEVEGTIESSGEASSGACKGRFEFQDTDSVMQGALDGTPFRLDCEDGTRHKIRVDAVTAGSKPGYSQAEFSGV